jgi:hypothetical protein
MKLKKKIETLETHTPPPQMNSASIFAFSLSSKVQRETDPNFFSSSFLLCVCATTRGERERVETLNLCMNDCVFSACWD